MSSGIVEHRRTIDDVMLSIRTKIAKRTVEEAAKEAVTDIKAEMPAKVAQEQAWLPFAPMPSDMCRVSPFFPMNPRQLERREYIDGLVITTSAWGEIKYYGPKLSTFDEDVLLALLAMLNAAFKPEENAKEALVYSGPVLPLLKLMGVNDSGLNYKRVTATLRRLALAGLEISTKKGSWMLNTILSGVVGHEKNKSVAISVNPYFYEMYVAGNVSLLDVVTRAKLKRPVAKALYRFATSHRSEWRGHFLTLAAAINLDLEQPHKELRRSLKEAMAELRKHGLIGTKSMFSGTDVITLQRAVAKEKNVRSLAHPKP